MPPVCRPRGLRRLCDGMLQIIINPNHKSPPPSPPTTHFVGPEEPCRPVWIVSSFAVCLSPPAARARLGGVVTSLVPSPCINSFTAACPSRRFTGVVCRLISKDYNPTPPPKAQRRKGKRGGKGAGKCICFVLTYFISFDVCLKIVVDCNCFH